MQAYKLHVYIAHENLILAQNIYYVYVEQKAFCS